MIFVIAVSLSMDAFSLSLAYGTQNLEKKDIIKLSSVVGIYHFFMPIFGMFLGMTILHIFPINPNWLVCIILSIIGIQMIVESFKKESTITSLCFSQLLIFGLAVSIDSFSVGIGLRTINENYLLSSAIFSVTSFAFTYLGLVLGKKLNLLLGKIATIVGGITLIVIGVMYLFH